MRHDPNDLCSKAGAEALAAKLDLYWHERGFSQVQHWVEPAALSSRKRGPGGVQTKASGWVVRSNLVRGKPPE